LIERDEDGFLVANGLSLKSCYTQARTMEELIPRIEEVIELCLLEEEPVPLSFEAVIGRAVPAEKWRPQAAL